MGYRYLTQHALTGAWLTSDLPLTDVEFGPDLNGPGHLRGTLEPHLGRRLPEIADAGNTLIYVERDGYLRWGGIIWRAEPEGDKVVVEAAGWTSYLQRRRDLDGELGGRGPYVRADPCRIICDIVAYAQSIPDGDLGLSVDGITSSATVGSPAEPWHSRWWENPVLGDQLDDLVKGPNAPDYTCGVWWDSARRPVRRIQLGYPRLGRRRDDLSFSTGINIITSTPVQYSADDYAQVVIATGTGEGRSQKRAIDAVRNGRLRLEHALDLPDVRATETLAQRARAERTWRQRLGHIEEITVRDHPQARIGAWQIGDDVQVAVRDQWTTWSGWCRITGWTIHPDTAAGETATIQLAPADSYQYGAAA
ncbi:hypothetical protein [Streptomyces violascens]|uniref:Minor tail protein n=1 Tax=Streptomyces violascens TaxID=67381 RepID=A0ABQ3QV64_9ACTN|nr:hypothetical protein [Streptomyces violascens]GGU44196.1 hypothetical protein GCM10010289_76090 [Streptomyces violascens]GHI41176.1 hypothetical protein Sviol_55840 [Streptomyces violascens]